MYKVFFNEIEIFNSDSLEACLSFALSFHQASRITHSIRVYDPILDGPCVNLVFKAPEKPVSDGRVTL